MIREAKKPGNLVFWQGFSPPIRSDTIGLKHWDKKGGMNHE